jgi:hypothetical protein
VKVCRLIPRTMAGAPLGSGDFGKSSDATPVRRKLPIFVCVQVSSWFLVPERCWLEFVALEFFGEPREERVTEFVYS